MIVINLLGVVVIGLIIWWFWLYQPRSGEPKPMGDVIIVEHGIYTPTTITIAAGQPTSLQFLRKDESPCAEMVLIPALNISETLPLNKIKSLQLPALEAGHYAFHCQMQMYRGSLNVEKIV